MIVTLAGLMNDVNPRCFPLQYGQAAKHGFVDGVCALASAKHKNGRCAPTLGRNLEKRLPHGNAGNFGARKILCRLLKMHSCSGY